GKGPRHPDETTTMPARAIRHAVAPRPSSGRGTPPHTLRRAARRPGVRSAVGCGALLVLALSCRGGTPVAQDVPNGLKVGPNYHKPPAAVAPDWIDASDKRLRRGEDDLSKWWTVFHDPVLDSLICAAYKQNLTLREAGFRVLQARAQLGIAVGNFFP